MVTTAKQCGGKKGGNKHGKRKERRRTKKETHTYLGKLIKLQILAEKNPL